MSLDAAIQLVRGAATSSTRSLSALQSALDGVRGRVDRARSSFTSWLKTANQRPRDDKGRWLPDSSIFGRARAGLASVRDGIRSAASAASTLKGLLAGALLAGVGALAGAGARYAADALSFRENTTFAFQVLTRSASKAQELMGFSDELARSLGKSTVEVGGSVRELLSKGFDPEMIRSIVSGMADLSTINPEANVKLLTMAIGQVKSKRFLMMEELRNQIAEQGLDIQAVYKHIAQNLGIRQDEVEKAISGKKVTAETGITSVLQSIQDMGGGGALGAVSAAKATQTLGGAFDNARSMAQRMLLAINTGPVGQKLIALTHRAANLFDPAQPGGKRLLAVLDRVASSFDDVVGKITIDDLTSAFNQAADAANNFVTAAKGLGGGIFDGYKEASATIKEVKEALGLTQGPADKTASSFRSIGKAIGYVVVGLSTVIDVISAIPTALKTLPENLKFIGRELMNGLGAGVDENAGRPKAAVRAVAKSLPSEVRSELKIQSPSRVFMQIGAHTTAGFVAGLERGPQPHTRMVEMMRPPPPEPLPTPGLTVQALAPRGAGSVVVHLTVPVNIEGRDVQEPEQLAERIGTEVRRQVTALFEELTLEAGTA